MAAISTEAVPGFSQEETAEVCGWCLCQVCHAPSQKPCSLPTTCPLMRAQIRTALLSWYDVNHRVLPWRRNPHSKRALADPAYVCPPAALPLNEFIYFVWVCEVPTL